MQTLDSLVLIAEIILFVMLSILAIYIIASLKRITAAIEKIENNADEFQKKVAPVLENAVIISGNVKEISTEIKNNVDKIDDVVDSFKKRTESILEFEKNAQDKIEYQFNDTLNLVSAITTGIKTFFAAFGSKNHLPRRKQAQ